MMGELDESTADDGAIYDFWEWWGHRDGPPLDLDVVADVVRAVREFDAR
jgi:hypothetical protein